MIVSNNMQNGKCATFVTIYDPYSSIFLNNDSSSVYDFVAKLIVVTATAKATLALTLYLKIILSESKASKTKCL